MKANLLGFALLTSNIVSDSDASKYYIDDTLNDTAVHILLDSLLNQYDKRIRPRDTLDGPTIVHCDLYIRSISSIDEISMDFSVDILVRQYWRDPRLTFQSNKLENYLDGSPEVVEKVWKPDLFFANERQGYFHDISVPNNMFRLYPNGHVLYSSRYSLVLSCDMDFSRFPFDVQQCLTQIGSFGFTEKALIFRWKEPNPISVNNDMKLPKFNLTNWETVPCRNEHYTGNFSCLRFIFEFNRELGYHVFQSYIPNVLLVIASWISFFLDVDAIPARCTLGVTTLLTTTAQASNIRSILPQVSYTKAIDVWIGTCTFFVFMALLEFAVVNYIARKDLKKALALGKIPKAPSLRPPVLAEQTEIHQNDMDQVKVKIHQHKPSNRFNHVLTERRGGLRIRQTHAKSFPECPDCGEPLMFDMHDMYKSGMCNTDLIDKPNAKRIDKISRYLFPIAFLIFVFVYIIVYVVQWDNK